MMASQSSPVVSAYSIVRSGPASTVGGVLTRFPVFVNRAPDRPEAGDDVGQAIAALFDDEDVVRGAEPRRAKIEPPAEDERAVAVAQHQVAGRDHDIEVAVGIRDRRR